MKSHFDWRKTPGLGPYTALILVFLYAPLFVLVAYSFNAGSLVTVWAGFSFQWFAIAAANGDIQEAALNSLIVAASATALATIIATFAAIGLERGPSRWAGPFAALFALPLLVPEIVTAVTTLVFFSSIHLRWGISNLVIAHTVFCIAFAMMPIRARLRGMGDQLENAARDLYAPPIKVFLRVTLPLLSPGIVSGAVLAFVVSLDDFVLSAMVGDAGTTTLPVYVYGMIRRGITPEVNAASTILLAVSLLLAGIAQYLNRPRNSA
ncbi:ABC transporter permease [Kaistia dalseonensis]|uniref:Spermidine/putrescine transport system permease protein PotC n=1 Tax=Kaistia dalseonensis TaxID=410840 RepID=A0ABU0H0U6_9HYPH|nr:ABC transporter permease [Kaistia dalseonensis]MCX5493363.1 ABC transporter permease [Kaistia dalseonensis]MDQ0435921.1 spermidine/putrescine transport system permease protein [Kaistia dalseonensis]